MDDTNKKQIASYMNLKGTTLPSFKMGKNGIEFYSEATENLNRSSQETLKTLFLKNTTGADAKERDDLDLAAEPNENGEFVPYYKDYDMAIASKNIKRLYATKAVGSDEVDTLTLVLVNGERITLSQRVEASAVLILPQDAKEGEIAVYGKDADGNTMMSKSERSFTDEIDKDDLESEKENSDIPSVKAVVKHINDITTPLNERLSGDNVSK